MQKTLFSLPSNLEDTKLRVRCCDAFIDKHDEKQLLELTIKQVENKLKDGIAVYEFLTGARRLYFDIENLVVQSIDELDCFIVQLIEDFCSFYQIFGVRYIVTMNMKSRHPGLSLHIFTDIYIQNAQMARDMIRLFVRSNLQYRGIIDVLVYNDEQYMRMPYSRNALQGIVYKESISFSKKKEIEVNGDKVTVISKETIKPKVIEEPEANKEINDYIRCVICSKKKTLVDVSGTLISERTERSSVDVIEAGCNLRDVISERTERSSVDKGFNFDLNENDFHFIYKSTYADDYDKSVPFIISDIRDCTLYSNRLPHIVLPIDDIIQTQKFNVKFDESDRVTGSYGGSYDEFIYQF